MKKVLSIILGVILGLVVLFFGIMTIIEYKPADVEQLTVNGSVNRTVNTGEKLSVMTWNVGYAGLSANADFFMDGGKNVKSCNKEQVNGNLAGIIDVIKSQNPDVVFLQEVDEKSKRSFYINEYERIAGELNDFKSVQAYNYVCEYVPFPFPTIGKVKCGLATFSSYDIDIASRVSLPCPFTWPGRLANLKRCLNVNRLPVVGTDKELVLINLHLEAYDDGEGKAAQTAMLANILQKEYDAGNYVIAGGDFNQTFSNVDISRYPVNEDLWQAGKIDVEDFGKDFNLLMYDAVPSCRSLDQPYDLSKADEMQVYIIDGFIVSKNLELSAIKTIDQGFKYSDHNPVILEVILK